MGSSPLTRGKPIRAPRLSSGHGLIPAHAGKTTTTAIARSCPRAHPRSRGENGLATVARLESLGSSPLTRGKPPPPWAPGVTRGLIPAHAGKTSSGRRRTHSEPAHPRSRGENYLFSKLSSSKNGSSPLTRGKLFEVHLFESPERLIPAHAGKTRGQGRHIPRRRAHPRSRGENLASMRPLFTAAGSSPLTRGKQFSYKRLQLEQGLIPAHAGKTASVQSTRTRLTAHPRSRGEN